MGKALFVLVLFFFFLFPTVSFGQTILLDGLTDSVSTCSGTLYDSGGELGNYGNNEDYEITIYSSSGDALIADIDDFDTRWPDILYIYDGDSSTATLIGQHTSGFSSTPSYISSGDCLTFRFESNNGGNDPGFKINLSCAPPATGYLISDAGSPAICSGTLYDSGGSGNPYSANENYTKTFSSLAGYALEADFLSLDLNRDDELVIYDGPDTSSDVLVTLNRFSSAGVFTSTDTALTFQFTSDNSWGEGDGFVASLSCVTIAPVHTIVDGGTLRTCSSRIYDDGGQSGDYGAGNTILQNVCSDDGSSAVMIDFTSADYPDSDDYLEIYDGKDALGTLLYTITGSDLPSGPFISTDSCLSIVTESDNNWQGAGFSADVSCIPIVPGDTISDDTVSTCSARLYDTGGQAGNYGASEDITMVFCSDNGSTLDATIFSLDIRDGDTLFIYDGSSTSDTELASFTSTTAILGPYASSDTCLTFRFTSDNIGSTGAGFAIDIACAAGLPEVDFNLASSSGLESVVSTGLQVDLTNASVSDVTVDYAVTGTATGGGVDYTLADGTLTITAGNTTGTITIAGIVDDAIYEGAETVIVTLSNPGNATLGTDVAHTYTITDNDGLPEVDFNLASSSGLESVVSTGLQVDLTNASVSDVTVDYAVTGTATGGGVDYTLADGTLTITAGNTTGTITIAGIVDDAIYEGAETVIVTLSNPGNATLGTDVAHTYTITDNDGLPSVTLSESGSPIAENGGVSTITATLSAISGFDVTVDLAYSGTATGGSVDYTASGPSITIPAGSATGSITITGDDDALDEGNETVIVDISNVTNGTEDGTQQQTITIVDDDSPPVITTCAADRTINADASCQAIIPDLISEVVATDNDVIVSITQLPAAGTVVSTGVHTVTITVTDNHGNETTCTADITVIDDIAPVASCQDITVQLDGTGNASILAADVDGGSTDNCAIATMDLDISSFTCADIGDNIVTLTVTDASGNISTCTATVTVEDILPPVISCPADETVTAAAGDCSMVVDNIAPVSVADNCGGTLQVSYRLEGATTGTGPDDASGTTFNKGITTVWYIVEDQNSNEDSCSFTVTVLTTVVPPDNASGTPDEVCSGDGDITLSYSGGVMPEGGIAMWYDDAGFTNNIGAGNDLNIPAPVVTSTYYVRFEGSCDTTTAVSTTVAVKALTSDPTSASVDRSNVCQSDGLITLSYIGGALGANGIAVWYEDAGFTASVGTGNNLSIAAPMTTTSYYLRFEADCDTSAAVSADVTVWPIPEPVLSEGEAKVCINGPLYRYVVDGLAGSMFAWNATNGTIVSQDNDTIYVDWGSQVISGTVEVTEISANGCISVPVILEVEVGGPDIDLGENFETCEGISVTIDPEGDFTTYLWHDGSTAPTYTADQEGWITVEVSDAFGCSATDSVYLTVYDLPVVDLGPDTVVCGDEGITLDAGTDGLYYQWSTGEISQEITVYMGSVEEYWVEVEDEYACIGGDTVIVKNCSFEFFFRDIPTAITPSDGNGLNDFWVIDKLLSYPQSVVEIFDRWGTLVWRSEPGYSLPWDGRNMKGEEMPMDSYHFVIQLNSGASGRDDRVTGIITVIK